MDISHSLKQQHKQQTFLKLIKTYEAIYTYRQSHWNYSPMIQTTREAKQHKTKSSLIPCAIESTRKFELVDKTGNLINLQCILASYDKIFKKNNAFSAKPAIR